MIPRKAHKICYKISTINKQKWKIINGTIILLALCAAISMAILQPKAKTKFFEFNYKYELLIFFFLCFAM